MSTLFAILAQTPSPTTVPVNKPWFAPFLDNMFLPLILVMLFMWVMMGRGRKNEERKRQEMLKQLKKGDRIQTIGGILGTVVEARETEILVKVDENSNAKIRFARSAIHRVLEEEKPQGK